MSLFEVKNYTLQCGVTLPSVQVAYKTYGRLKGDNVIVYPSWFTGFIEDNEWLIGDALDAKKYFIIVVCALGNGQSTSPSNTAGPFPDISLYDNVMLQHKLVTEVFHIRKIKLVVGWSMGAQQTYQWACLFPEMIENIAPICGSAKTAPHNFVFLEGVKAALEGGKNEASGLRAAARVYAGWGFSQPFYRKECWRKLGFSTLEDFLTGFWDAFFLKRKRANVLAMLNTWQYADISANAIFKGDIRRALRSIVARTLVMPAERDLYFPVADSAWEVDHINRRKTGLNATLLVIPGVWGHFAADGLNPKDTKFINAALHHLLL